MRLFPTVAEATAAFAGAGLELLALERKTTVLAPSLTAFAERLRLRAISTFDLMDEAEIEAGFQALDAAVRAELEPSPIRSEQDLLVFGRSWDLSRAPASRT